MPNPRNTTPAPEALQGLLELQTPEVLALPALAHNIADMQRRADDAGLELWPHFKTHKCLEIARMQLTAGAKGLTVSKVSEALVCLRGGIGPLLVAYPLLDKDRITTLLREARQAEQHVRCIIDSTQGVQALAQAAMHLGENVDVCIKIDVGLRRCGVLPDSPELPLLARQIDQAPRLRLRGLLSHAGHAYAAKDAAEVRDIARKERLLLLQAAKRLPHNCRLSVGCTPTALAADDFSGLHELRPGNYVFMDRTPLRFGLIQQQDIALAVLATVISKNSENIIIDAGSKTLGLDKAPHGLAPQDPKGGDFGHGLLHWLDCDGLAGPRILGRLSEEHGFIPRAQAPEFDPPLGARVLITPNHACIVANLALRLALVSPDAAPRFLEVDARGQVR